MSAKPTCVYLVSRFPYPLEKGDKLRAFNQIKGLSEAFSVVLICCSEQDVKQSDYNQVKQYCETIHVFRIRKLGLIFQLILALFTKKPIQVHYFFRFLIAFRINKLLSEIKPDHIFCQLVRMSEYVKNYHYCPKTLDYMDALSKGMDRRAYTEKWPSSWFCSIESARLAIYERRIFDYFEHKIIISEQDRKYIQHPKNNSIQIIPNGVDTRFFEDLKLPKLYDIVFTGNFSYSPNIDAAVRLVEEILPKLREKGVDATVLISGASPTKRVRELASKNVIVTGWVDDIRLSYQQSRLFVAPLMIGTGLQNKLLEAMASGLPCITTSLANNALKGTNEENIRLAETIDEFVEIIDSFQKNTTTFSSLALNGKKFVEENYSWNYQNAQLIQLVQSHSS